MDDLIGVLIFIIFAILAVAGKYREAQQRKNLKPPPPKPRRAPRTEELPQATRRQFQRREVKMARPAAPREARRPVSPSQRPAQPRSTTQRVPQRPLEPPKTSPFTPWTGSAEQEEPPRRRREQRRAPQEPARKKQTLEQMHASPAQRRAGRQAAREKLQVAVEQETETGFETPAAMRKRRAAQLPPLFRSMEGIRAGIIFSEILSPPISLR